MTLDEALKVIRDWNAGFEPGPEIRHPMIVIMRMTGELERRDRVLGVVDENGDFEPDSRVVRMVDYVEAQATVRRWTNGHELPDKPKPSKSQDTKQLLANIHPARLAAAKRVRELLAEQPPLSKNKIKYILHEEFETTVADTIGTYLDKHEPPKWFQHVVYE